MKTEGGRKNLETPYAIEMLNITKRFPGIIANDNITLQLKKGEIHALLGENGAGKSTLMSVLFGLYQPEEGTIKKDGEVVGNRVRAKVVKNKVAPPFRQAEFDLMYGEGISREGCIVDMAVECGVAKKSGAWYTYGEERLGQGREAAKATLRQNPEMREELENKVREAFEIPIPTRTAEEADAVTPVAKPKKK